MAQLTLTVGLLRRHVLSMHQLLILSTYLK
ncbi:hypothetical protein XBP1_960055 [Xenorhabdus bovienii str. puntauvense]|uniref:Uncharacterized protein n=1 Tax=Xenorhabdus bovienii str. puntauvense TaxID=1398201 RepID=A0A077NKW7_XENBV|nr:hypothetical protein XBP1_960055 [Xenorhabdus bovienii str. puntauvense]